MTLQLFLIYKNKCMETVKSNSSSHSEWPHWEKWNVKFRWCDLFSSTVNYICTLGHWGRCGTHQCDGSKHKHSPNLDSYPDWGNSWIRYISPLPQIILQTGLWIHNVLKKDTWRQWSRALFVCVVKKTHSLEKHY